MSTLIEIKDVKKIYPLGNTEVHALRGVSLEINKGEFLSIMGPSGSGKTTLLNIIGLIDDPSQGVLVLDNETVFNRTDAQKMTLNDSRITRLRLEKIGFIFQNFNLIPVLNVLENVEFPLLLQKKQARKEIREKAESLIESVGLKEYIKHRPAELSGGQRQRVAIARALVTDPAIILADEPTANLDSETSHTILTLMKEMNQKRHTTFIFSTHDPDVRSYAERTIHLRDGLISA